MEWNESSVAVIPSIDLKASLQRFGYGVRSPKNNCITAASRKLVKRRDQIVTVVEVVEKEGRHLSCAKLIAEIDPDGWMASKWTMHAYPFCITLFSCVSTPE